jgi:hypothetical protein
MIITLRIVYSYFNLILKIEELKDNIEIFNESNKSNMNEL